MNHLYTEQMQNSRAERAESPPLHSIIILAYVQYI